MPDSDGPPSQEPSNAASTGRIKVALSSVAKTPSAPPKEAALTANISQGAILPPKETAPQQASSRPQLNRTVEVKLPPKTGVMPQLTTLSNMPQAPASAKKESLPEPISHIVPASRKKRRLFPNLRLRPFRLRSPKPEESIFPSSGAEDADKPVKVPPLPPLLPVQPAVTPPALPKVGPPPVPAPVAPPLLDPHPEEKLRPPPLKTTPPPLKTPAPDAPPPLPSEPIKKPADAAPDRPKLSSALKGEMRGPETADSFILPNQEEEKISPFAPAQPESSLPLAGRIETKPETPVLAETKPAEATPRSPTPSKKKIDEKTSFQVTEPPPPVSIRSKGSAKKSSPAVPAGPISSEVNVTASRSARVRKRRLIGVIAFYFIFIVFVIPLFYFLAVAYTSETRVEGQIIPPRGTMLCDEVWIVSDFRELASGIADDLAAERAPKVQEIQERQDHVQRAQADIAAREERIRLLQDQIQAAKDEIASSVKQAHDAAQRVWDGPGAALENEYKDKLAALQNAIAARAQSLHLQYAPDNTYQSPEVWANAYRLALYQTPPGVDGTKEHQWIEDQLNQWRAYTKSFDDRREKLRLQAAQIQLSPSAHIADLNSRIDDLQHRVDSTQAEEEPLKTELQQAQADLSQSQGAEANLDPKYYAQLYALPESSITKRLSLRANGRFTWPHLEKDSAFSQGEKSHAYWIFSRAVRKDGRQFWVLAHFAISQNSILPILIEPASFISTKTILRPDLPTEEQQQ